MSNLVFELLHKERGDVLDLFLRLLDVGPHAVGAVHHEDEVNTLVLLEHPLEQILAMLESAPGSNS